jgi:hypothetical protein
LFDLHQLKKKNVISECLSLSSYCSSESVAIKV